MPINTFREDEETKEGVKLPMLRRLLRYLIPYKKSVLKVFALIALILAVQLFNPFFLQVGIDYFIDKTQNIPGLLAVGALVVALNILSMFAIRLRLREMAKLSNRVLYQIRQDLYEHLQTLAFRYFDERPAGKILARVIGDVNSLKELFNQCILTLLPNLVKLVCVCVIMLILNVKLALFALLIVPLLAVGLIFIQRRAHRGWRLFRKKNSNLNAFVHENMSGIRVVQGFAAQGQMNRNFNGLIRQQRGAYISAVRYTDLFWAFVEVAWGVGSIIVYWAGVRMLDTGHITVGLLVSFSSYLSMFWQPIMDLSNFYNNLVTNMAAAERIFEVLDTEPEIQDADGAQVLPPIKGEVEFQHVTFGYDPQVPVLRDVSFSVAPGQSIALVGPTGAGKTSIINLISRFYDIQEGTILLDGHDITQVTLESLRSQMGIMPQDTFLFSGTIKDNIRYGRLDATDEEIVEAAKAVHAHEFIVEMEKGYDTDIQERGGCLSVGQRQLVAFARAMLSNPRILILDEATSSIDTHTERLVQAGIRQLLAGRTSFVIAHRLSTIQQADQILVIDKGQLMEHGTHGELMEKKGLYYNLFMAQFLRVG